MFRLGYRLWFNGCFTGVLVMTQWEHHPLVLLMITLILWCISLIGIIYDIKKRKGSEKTIKQLNKALKEFGQHKEWCHWRHFVTEDCDCGLHFLQREAKKLKNKT